MAVVMGYPVDAASASDTAPSTTSPIDPAARARFLAGLGVPAGLAAQYIHSAEDFALRLWIIDNSGSMATHDGNRVGYKSDGTQMTMQCSRWDELGDSLEYHGILAANLGAPTQFRVLNPPGGGVPQTMWCGAGDPGAEEDAIRWLRRTSPTGRTPLCGAINVAIQTIVERAPALKASGKRAVLVIASDGAATDGDVSAALKPLQDLPVWVVVRLCTDDAAVVNYWNSIDEQLELDLDVLDDLSGEAAEVCAHSRWLTYGPALHRLREWGCSDKLLDLLDERPLAPAEMRNLAAFVLGGGAAELPDPKLEWPLFETRLAAALQKERPVYDPLKRKMRPWFDVAKMRQQLNAGGSGCALM